MDGWLKPEAARIRRKPANSMRRSVYWRPIPSIAIARQPSTAVLIHVAVPDWMTGTFLVDALLVDVLSRGALGCTDRAAGCFPGIDFSGIRRGATDG
jgi:hypothetical protein